MKTTHFRKGRLIIPAHEETGKPDYLRAEDLKTVNQAKKRSRQIGLMKVRRLV